MIQATQDKQFNTNDQHQLQSSDTSRLFLYLSLNDFKRG